MKKAGWGDLKNCNFNDLLTSA
uniref:Uncharacterized protein n=1 Tax=Anguilla anguilla TaxID=7936 RepID=A0A0E9T156_ANGAN